MVFLTIPVTISPDSQARVAELGLQDELDDVLEFTTTTLRDIHSVAITLFRDELEPDGQSLRITVWKAAPYLRRDPERKTWIDGVVQMTTDSFRRWFVFDVYPVGENDAR